MRPIKVRIWKRSGRANWDMAYREPETGRTVCKSTLRPSKKEAAKVAAVWESRLNAGLLEPTDTGWDCFRTRFEDEYLPNLSKAGAAVHRSALNSFEAATGTPTRLSQVTASRMSQYQAAMRKQGVAENTLRTYLKHLRVALRWAASMEMVRNPPRVAVPRSSGSQSKGRPITDSEFMAMLDAADRQNMAEPESVKWFLRGLWFSGFRIGELMRLSYDSPPVQLDMTGGNFPRVIWSASGQKSRINQIVVITKDFAQLINERPLGAGPVFPLVPKFRQINSTDYAGRIISACGKLAGVKVNDKKYASAHDLRRSFATRWAPKFRHITLMQLMRHADINTTLQFYVDIEADDLGREVWQ